VLLRVGFLAGAVWLLLRCSECGTAMAIAPLGPGFSVGLSTMWARVRLGGFGTADQPRAPPRWAGTHRWAVRIAAVALVAAALVLIPAAAAAAATGLAGGQVAGLGNWRPTTAGWVVIGGVLVAVGAGMVAALRATDRAQGAAAQPVERSVSRARGGRVGRRSVAGLVVVALLGGVRGSAPLVLDYTPVPGPAEVRAAAAEQRELTEEFTEVGFGSRGVTAGRGEVFALPDTRGDDLLIGAAPDSVMSLLDELRGLTFSRHLPFDPFVDLSRFGTAARPRDIVEAWRNRPVRPYARVGGLEYYLSTAGHQRVALLVVRTELGAWLVQSQSLWSKDVGDAPGVVSGGPVVAGDLVERVVRAVVRLRLEDGRGLGSGVLIDPYGTVLTAGHVVDAARREGQGIVAEMWNGRTIGTRELDLPDAERVQRQLERVYGPNRLSGPLSYQGEDRVDLGALRLTVDGTGGEPASLPFLPVARSRPGLGEPVLSVGYPGTEKETQVLAVTGGPVGPYGATNPSDRPDIKDFGYLGFAAHGFSGGAIVNARGELVVLLTNGVVDPDTEVTSVHSQGGPEITGLVIEMLVQRRRRVFGLQDKDPGEPTDPGVGGGPLGWLEPGEEELVRGVAAEVWDQAVPAPAASGVSARGPPVHLLGEHDLDSAGVDQLSERLLAWAFAGDSRVFMFRQVYYTVLVLIAAGYLARDYLDRVLDYEQRRRIQQEDEEGDGDFDRLAEQLRQEYADAVATAAADRGRQPAALQFVLRRGGRLALVHDAEARRLWRELVLPVVAGVRRALLEPLLLPSRAEVVLLPGELAQLLGLNMYEIGGCSSGLCAVAGFAERSGGLRVYGHGDLLFTDPVTLDMVRNGTAEERAEFRKAVQLELQRLRHEFRFMTEPDPAFGELTNLIETTPGGRRLVVGGGRASHMPPLSRRDDSINITADDRPGKVGDIATTKSPAGHYQEVFFEGVPFPAFTGAAISALAESMAALRVGGTLIIWSGVRAAPDVPDIVAQLRRLGAVVAADTQTGTVIVAVKTEAVDPAAYHGVFLEAGRRARELLTGLVFGSGDAFDEWAAYRPEGHRMRSGEIRRMSAVRRHAEERAREIREATGLPLASTEVRGEDRLQWIVAGTVGELLNRRVWLATAAELAAGVGVSVDDLLEAGQASPRLFVSPSREGRDEGDRLVVLASEGVDSHDRADVLEGTIVEVVLPTAGASGQRTVRIDGPVAVIAPHEHADVVLTASGYGSREHALLVHRADGWHLLTDRGTARYGELPVDADDTSVHAGSSIGAGIGGGELNVMSREGFARMEAALREAGAMTAAELARLIREPFTVVEWALGLSPRFIVSQSREVQFWDRLVILRPSGMEAQRQVSLPGRRIQLVERRFGGGRHFEIRRPTAIVGNHPGADVVIDDASVAKVQAVFVELVDGWYVADLAPKRKSRSNRGPGGAARKVRDGERIRLGGIKIRLRITGSEAGHTGLVAGAGSVTPV
jgi:S1-C subfamily serine protease